MARLIAFTVWDSMIGIVVDKRVAGLTVLFVIPLAFFIYWNSPPVPSELVTLEGCTLPRADVEYASEKFVRVRVKNDQASERDQASAGTMLFIKPQRDQSRSTAAIRTANLVDLAPLNSEYDISVEADFPGFTLYQERYGNQNKYYVKDTAPKVLISIDSASGMRVFREIPPAIEVDYVVRKDDVRRLDEINTKVDSYVNAHCLNAVVS